MKRVKRVIGVVAVCLMLPLSGGLVGGCASTPQTVAYKTAGTTVVSVETTMASWNAWVKAGKATLAQEVAVRDAYRKYQLAMAAVCDAGAAYSAAVANNQTSTVGSLSSAFQYAVANGSQSIADLQNLVLSFGVK